MEKHFNGNIQKKMLMCSYINSYDVTERRMEWAGKSIQKHLLCCLQCQW